MRVQGFASAPNECARSNNQLKGREKKGVHYDTPPCGRWSLVKKQKID